MLILKLTPESSDEHCGLPIFLSKVTDENNESTLSMMCGTPLWHGTCGPGWLSPFEIQLIKNLVKCNHGWQSQLLSCRLFSIYVHVVSPLCNTKIWSVEMFFFLFLQPSADSGTRVSLKLSGRKSQGLPCQSPKPLTFLLPLQHVVAL